MEKILFISLGCDKNLADSEEMLGLLASHGYQITDDEACADAIVINTCCFIGDAKEESIQTILEMAEYRKSGPCRALVVAGCLAQRYQDEIAAEIPEVDVVLGTTAMEDLLAGKSISTGIDEEIIFEQLEDSSEAIWSLLLASGYLKVEGVSQASDEEDSIYLLALTNLEVRKSFRKMIQGFAFEGKTVLISLGTGHF